MTLATTTHQQQRRFKLIKRPHVSEKATLLADKHRQFVFQVQIDANKSEIKQAVESLFSVKVDAVQLLNVKPKAKRFKQTEGRSKAWKKAYVSLAEGHDIDFTGTK
ncbi:50S ribosomal protein L23 [Rickettsiella endosymbiont of Dermanyssus gallinae]|uniref:50S ribosomal protein L23 n=1 Tax=Rickettsiella endosymbiont of Dermanyssus gallinae TaxID=2856608 RepID=UPI001C52F701|nr:50S ribosomal protein L23 [Rickettsiella endosymbiont of Dermanyssus gallinae]